MKLKDTADARRNWKKFIRRCGLILLFWADFLNSSDKMEKTSRLKKFSGFFGLPISAAIHSPSENQEKLLINKSREFQRTQRWKVPLTKEKTATFKVQREISFHFVRIVIESQSSEVNPQRTQMLRLFIGSLQSFLHRNLKLPFGVNYVVITKCQS
jgi:hypothetical protein